MKHFLRVALLSIVSAFNCKADIIQGIDASSGKIVLAWKKKIVIASLNSGQILNETTPANDGKLAEALIDHCNTLNKRQSAEDFRPPSDRMDDLSTVSLTWNKNRIFAAVRFNAGNKPGSALLFGILEYDTLLNLVDYYVFRSTGICSLLPFHPLEIDTAGCFLLPAIDSGRICLLRYRPNAATHTLLSAGKSDRGLQMTPLNQFKFPERITIDPLIYSVKGSDYRFYYRYPFPTIYKTGGQILFDGLGFRDKSGRNHVPGYKWGLNMLVNNDQKSDTFVVIGTSIIDDTIRILLTSPNPELQMLFTISASNGIFYLKNIRVSREDSFLYMYGRKLLIVKRHEEELSIEMRNL